jgi:hypothetical protein
MSLLIATRRRVAVAATGLALAGAAGAFALTSGAFASSAPTPSAPTPPTPAASSSTTTSLPSAGRSGAAKCHDGALVHHHGLLARTDFATVEVFRHGHWQNLVLDRGDVTAVSTSRITIKRPDGVTVTIALAPATKYHGVGSARDLMTNRPATVVSADGSALRVSQVVRSTSAMR